MLIVPAKEVFVNFKIFFQYIIRESAILRSYNIYFEEEGRGNCVW